MSRRLTIKSKLNNGEIRRTTVDTPQSFVELESICEMIHGTKSKRLYSTFVLQYLDDEGDKITLSTDADLKEAIRVSKTTAGILRLFLSPGKNRKSKRHHRAKPVHDAPEIVVATTTPPAAAAVATPSVAPTPAPAPSSRRRHVNEDESAEALSDATRVAEQAIVKANAAVAAALEQSKRIVDAIFNNSDGDETVVDSSLSQRALSKANEAVEMSKKIVADAKEKAVSSLEASEEEDDEVVAIAPGAGVTRGVFVDKQPVAASDDFVMVESPSSVESDAPKPKEALKNSFERNLETLESMGFTNRAENIRVLVKNKNVLYNSIQELI